MISDFIGSFFLKIVKKPKYDDSVVDRLHYHWTLMLIAILSLFIGAYQYGGNPINCWYPAEFKEWWSQYADQYCFVENTYFVPFAQQLPTAVEVRKKGEITYYQWVPFVLALQALLFYLPHMIWRALSWQSGIDVKKFVSLAVDCSVAKSKREGDVKIMVKHFLDALDHERDYGGKANPLTWLISCGKRSGVYVTLIYLLSKVLALLNVVGQLLLLNAFLGPQYQWWGPGILRDLANGTEWHTSGHFPRVTMCDFTVRDIGQVKQYTVQCVLWINMLNEKIYLFLWFWFVLVACITILELFNWLWITLLPSCRYNFVSRHVTANRLLKTDKNVTEAHLKNFALNRLRHDGVLILRLVADNAGEMVTTEIIDSLWDRIVGRSGTNGAFSPRNIAQFHEIDENTAARHSDSIESAGNSSPPGYTLATSRDRIFEAAN